MSRKQAKQTNKQTEKQTNNQAQTEKGKLQNQSSIVRFSLNNHNMSHIQLRRLHVHQHGRRFSKVVIATRCYFYFPTAVI